MRSTRLLLLGCLPLACVDFGADVDPEADAGVFADAPTTEPDAGAAGDSGEACVEGPTTPSTDGPQLEYRSLAVDQPMLVIQRGQVVTWTNGDTMRHSIVAGAPGAETPIPRGGFNSGELAPGAKFAVRFCSPKMQIYFCSTHPSQMNGYRIKVE